MLLIENVAPNVDVTYSGSFGLGELTATLAVLDISDIQFLDHNKSSSILLLNDEKS